jgi:hypothetical protein
MMRMNFSLVAAVVGPEKSHNHQPHPFQMGGVVKFLHRQSKIPRRRRAALMAAHSLMRPSAE